jgi:transcriptional regulator of NAD metabolism
MMTGEERREFIIDMIKKNDRPISGTKLAEACQVSRQIIVQDVALIRASGCDILSTNRGYIIQEQKSFRRTFKVQHTEEQVEEEMNAIVDLGGKLINVRVNHKIYGRVEAELNVGSRKRVREFMEDIKKGKSSPLMKITSNYHYHEVEAESEEILNEIEAMLLEKGILIR